MELVNHTPFPALAFQGIDQRGVEFHVLALRQTLRWNEQGQLDYADEQAPLCEQDEYFGAINQGGVRQESDLCQYKPRADIIVNGTAHAPSGRAEARFPARLRVFSPKMAPLPEPPRGINQHYEGAPEAMRLWRAEVAHLCVLPEPAEPCLIDKTIIVSGPREFQRCAGVLGGRWQLTEPQPTQTVPIRIDFAYGGQCRINEGDAAAARVAEKDQLTQDQRAQHPDSAAPAPQRAHAHSACEANPVGLGFSREWYLTATGIDQLPAPRIEHPEAPLTIEAFERGLKNQLSDQEADALITGFGVRFKGHPERRRYVGTIDERFTRSHGYWLPKDFDFAIWNAAPPDQQPERLHGDEVIELTNLSPIGTPGSRRDRHGNNVLRLVLPGNVVFASVRFENGAFSDLAAQLDTVVVDADEKTVSCVWRATVATMPNIRVIEARMLTKGYVAAFAAGGRAKQQREGVSAEKPAGEETRG